MNCAYMRQPWQKQKFQKEKTPTTYTNKATKRQGYTEDGCTDGSQGAPESNILYQTQDQQTSKHKLTDQDIKDQKRPARFGEP